MHPELFRLPGGVSIKTYGFFLMIGFLSAVWLAMRRAKRVRANPDVVLDMSFLALLFGVGGARVFYVVHYWESQFAGAANPLLAALDITEGGLEFLGGLLGAAGAIGLYAWIKKVSLRLYLDILTPGAMWGLAFGRIGCFFNGCCFGGMCVLPHDAPPTTGTAQVATAVDTEVPRYPWAVEFPYGSPAFYKQWQDRKVTVPAELITTLPQQLVPTLVSPLLLSMPVEARLGPIRKADEAKDSYERAVAQGAPKEELAQLKKRMEQAEKAKRRHMAKIAPLLAAQEYPSRVNPERKMSVSELQALAARYHSKPVHPTQLYSAIHAMLLCGVLSMLFYVRKRHGVVFGALFVLYPIPRMILELIRADNPHEFGGLTISQVVGLGMLAFGIVYLWFIYTRVPQRSPRLVHEPAVAGGSN